MKIFALLVVFILAADAFAADIHDKIRAAFEYRNYVAAAAELENLRNADRKGFEANNYDYLAGRVAFLRGDAATASAYFQSVVKRGGVLKEYALHHLAQIARESGNLFAERLYLQELLTVAPMSLLSDAAQNRLARSFYESGDYNSAAKMLNVGKPDFRASQTSGAALQISREDTALLGQIYRQTGKSDDARQIFVKLIDTVPNAEQPDDFALRAAQNLDAMDGATDLKAPPLDAAEHLRRAKIYRFNRDFADARKHFAAIVERFPTSPDVPEALFSIGRGYALENNFQEAIKYFERTIGEFPENNYARDALTQSASAYARVNKPKEAMTRYKQYIEKYPDGDNLERAYLNTVDILRDTGEESSAVTQTEKTRQAFKGELPEALALFAQTRVHFAQNDWTSALADLTELEKFPDLGGTRFPGATNKAEVAFLKAFALEQAKRFPEAINAYLAIPDGRAEYYGWRATERLRLMKANAATAVFVEAKINELKNLKGIAFDENRKTAQSLFRLTDDRNYLKTIREFYALVPAYKQIPGGKLVEFGRKEILTEPKIYPAEDYRRGIADELLFLGLYDEGTPELEYALRRKLAPSVVDKLKSSVGINREQTGFGVFPPDTAFTLATFYMRGNLANRAVAYAEPLWRAVPADYQIELIPRDKLELLYPAPYADSLLKYAPANNIDPRFALSIMRQESRYQADIKSYAAARGLMQFISSTADQIAGELDRKNFVQDELYHPPTAILFGSRYLSDLFRLFPNQPQAVAASYNGGETNMSRWLARAKSPEPDRYVPEILFAQSKDYVYKVMANYRVYQTIYDEQLRPR